MAYADRIEITSDTFDSSIDSDWDATGPANWNPCEWVSPGEVQPTTATDASLMFDDTNSFTADQYASVTLANDQNDPVNNYVVAGVRTQSADGSHVSGTGDPWAGQYIFYEWGNGPGVYTGFGGTTWNGAFSAGDILTTTVEGTGASSVYRFGTDEDSSGDTERINATREVDDDGDPGIHIYRQSHRATSFSAGNMGVLGNSTFSHKLNTSKILHNLIR